MVCLFTFRSSWEETGIHDAIILHYPVCIPFIPVYNPGERRFSRDLQFSNHRIVNIFIMLLLLALWLYISFICFTWGIIVCRFFTRGQNLAAIEFPHVSMICLLGLAAVGTVGLYLSLYMPLSGVAHLIIALPVIVCWLYAPVRRSMLPAFRKRILTGTVNWLLFLVLLLMTLSISSGLIIHPDTLSYHLQSIRWFEQFSAVPGIVNIDTELGMQSLWFAAHALFRPEITAGVFALYLNGAVLCWFFLFICS